MSTVTKIEINTNMSALTVNETIEQLSTIYVQLINQKLPLTTMPSVMLWGQPGIGKSQGVRQLAAKITAGTGISVNITDVRLLLFNPIDLRGIPTANADKTLAVWLKPQIFQMDESDDVLNILFLDEISAAPQSVQAAAYQITLDRTVGEHKLPANCIVIAAGNRVTDKSVAFKMPKALANRLCHIEIKSDCQSWKEWALNVSINEKVIGFLSFKQASLNRFEADDMLAFPTPRSWEMVSNILNTVSGDIESVYPLIAGCVGLGTAIEFRTWAKVFDELPSMEDIFSGKNAKAPASTDALYAVVASMSAYAKGKMDDMTAIENSIRYAQKLPPDYAALLVRNYMIQNAEFKQRLMQTSEFRTWLERIGKLLV